MRPPRSALPGAPTLLAGLLALAAWIARKESHVPEGLDFGLRVPTDLHVYLLAGRRLNEGGLLYDAPLLGELPFTYPPFAAGVFRWLATLSPDLATVLWQSANLAALVAVVLMVLQERGRALTLPVVAVGVAFAAAAFALEPVRGSFFYGQINMLLVLLVALDLLPKGRRWAGLGIGVAAGLKLTPAFLLLVLLVERRFRALLLAAAAFLGTVLLGFAVVPDAGRFWVDSMFDSGRVGAHTNPGAQSIRSVLERNLGVESPAVWLAVAVPVVALTALAVWLAVRRGNRSVALALAGIASCLVSPFSWFHHWVWVVVAAVAAAAALAELFDARGNWFLSQLGALVTLGVLALIALPYVSGVLSPELAYFNRAWDPSHPWNLLFTGSGLGFIAGYALYAGVLERKSRISATKRAGSAE